MSDYENETVADIAAELKDDATRVFSDEHDDDFWSNMEAGQIYTSLAIRLEAAIKRERARAGNAAAMREALEQIQKDIWELMAASSESYRKTRADILSRRIRAALSEPPRNCDRHCAEAAWNAYVEQNGAASDRSWKALILFVKWLYAPAEGGAE